MMGWGQRRQITTGTVTEADRGMGGSGREHGHAGGGGRGSEKEGGRAGHEGGAFTCHAPCQCCVTV